MLVQGVHAIANAAPATTGPPRPARRSSDSECHSRLNARTNGVARKITPSAMMTTPPICSSVCLWVSSADPRAVALKPSRMKIEEKLAMNSRLGTSTRRAPTPSSRSAGVTPMTVDR